MPVTKQIHFTKTALNQSQIFKKEMRYFPEYPIFTITKAVVHYSIMIQNLKSIYDLLLGQINALLQINPKFEIAILSSTKKGVKLLRDNLLHKLNDKQDQILINTVDSVQGLTIDFCFYFAFSDGSPAFSFKLNRFNVATSRARFCTLILLDEVYKVVQPYKGLVADFISKCDLKMILLLPKLLEETSSNESISA
jgi:hypothetical protein